MHLIKYDSTHGRFSGTVEPVEGGIMVNGKRIAVTAFPDPADIPWHAYGTDYVIEASGYFTSRALLQKHLVAGAKKVILSCPPKDQMDRTVVMGVNDIFLGTEDCIISNASCTTNCLAPVMMILEKELGIDRAFMNTVHPFTNNQVILDAPHKDLRRARTGAVNIIPTTSTAVEALLLIMPEMKGRFDGLAVRVPVHDGSLIELSVLLKKQTSVPQVNQLMKTASEGSLRGILGYTSDPIVSSDIIGDTHSAIFDALSTRVLGGNFLQLIIWYDNETGYSNRIVDLVIKMGCMDGIY
jgi:glyceraldehyde 3-phosphate dehydrogenase